MDCDCIFARAQELEKLEGLNALNDLRQTLNAARGLGRRAGGLGVLNWAEDWESYDLLTRPR
jgi:hypothetical protein